MKRPAVDPSHGEGGRPWPGGRRRAVILGLGAVVLLMGTAWFFWPVPAAEVAAPSPADPALTALVSQASARERGGSGPAAGASAGRAPTAAGTLEICGRSPLGRPRGPGSPEWRELAQAVLSDQMKGTARMLTHPDPRVVAAGWLQAERQGRPALGALHRAERAACRADRACEAEADARSGTRLRDLTQMARDPLAALAVSSGDAAIYAHAARACASEPRVAGHCAQVSTAQWTRLEPDNMDAWLQLADEAQARRDDAAVAEALHRAALAPRQETHLALRFDALQATAVPDTHPASRSLALTELIGASLAASRPGMTAVLAHCQADRLADANRHQACDALAEALVERGATFQDLDVGLTLGSRLRWPGERIAALRTDREAMLALAEASVSTDQPLGCAAIERLEAHLAERSRLGELAAVRAQRASTDARTQQAAMAAWADAEAKAAERAAAAKSAASGASAVPGGPKR